MKVDIAPCLALGVMALACAIARAADEPFVQKLEGTNVTFKMVPIRSAARMGSNQRMNQDPSLPKSPHWMADAPYVGFRVVSPVHEPREEEKRRWWDADDSSTLTTIQRDQERRAVISPGAVNR
jgi:hypothetical protein